MKKYVMSFAAVAVMLLMASCGNKGTGTNVEGAKDDAKDEAKAEVAYEQFTVEKYGASFDLLKGMRRTDNPQTDNGGCWTLVPEDSNDFPISAAVEFGVYESMFGDYTEERIKKEFDEDIPQEAEKKLDLEKKEYTYSIPSDMISEYHRVIFNGNKSINITVAYSPDWEKQLGGEVRDHILNSAKFN
ncbi:MAG: hypothetical protein J6W43_10385 [Prevotella sp.]|jgi:hypothetical protein|nr:hypothetical protein [Prevotella sp.]